MINEFKKMIDILEKDFEKCPWKKEQTLKKQIENLSSEVEELKEGINRSDKKNIEEELGDIFWDTMNLLFIAKRDMGIDIEKIFNLTNEKIVRRKPYVFGNMKVKTSKEALDVWNKIKKEER